ncbi:MAG: hypothetical protein II813_06925 [Spirochaetales bacterium]|nr:hypothetical protein [Spirochaetales bacterium]
MRKMILNAVLFLMVPVLVSCMGQPAIKDDYNSTVRTGGPIEAKYIAGGEYNVAYKELKSLQDFDMFEIYYPSVMDKGSLEWPVVIFSNGTGVKASTYASLLSHLASWGFIVMGTEEKNSWNGFSSEMCLRLIMKLNETETVEGWDDNPFYGHVDTSRIGVSGHSQGGVGVINAATENKNGDKVKAIFSASPTNMELAEGLMWDYDPGLVTCPIFLVSSTGSADEDLVVSGSQLDEIYDALPDTITKIKARRNDANHGDMLSYSDGYMTAWFMWQLCGDNEASKAFVGEGAEIITNSLYQDQRINIVE